jgi:hypothetical protein
LEHFAELDFSNPKFAILERADGVPHRESTSAAPWGVPKMSDYWAGLRVEVQGSRARNRTAEARSSDLTAES